jgi:thiamine monophosphate kinase
MPVRRATSSSHRRRLRGVPFGDGGIFLIAVDQVVEGRHFLDEGPFTASPQQVAASCCPQPSDIAAMGGTPCIA